MYIHLEGAARKVLRAMLRSRVRRGGRRGCGCAGGKEEVLTAQSESARGVGVGRRGRGDVASDFLLKTLGFLHAHVHVGCCCMFAACSVHMHMN